MVVSEEYFNRSKWPILELAAFVQARKCTILPLFFGLSSKEFDDTKRRQLWYKRWDEWAQEDPRIRVDVWKEALNELDRRNGLEYAETLGEVSYRKEVVATACTIVQRSLQDEVRRPLLFIFNSCAFIYSSLVFERCERVSDFSTACKAPFRFRVTLLQEWPGGNVDVHFWIQMYVRCR